MPPEEACPTWVRPILGPNEQNLGLGGTREADAE